MMEVRGLMRMPASLKSEIAYSRKLLEAGLDAAIAVRDGAPNRTLTPELVCAARSAWVPTLIGAAAGVLTLRLAGKGRSGRDALVGGLVGAAIGFGGGLGFGLRQITAMIAQGAAKNLVVVRDAHWIEKHPINYA
jgi:hypothetical protein